MPVTGVLSKLKALSGAVSSACLAFISGPPGLSLAAPQFIADASFAANTLNESFDMPNRDLEWGETPWDELPKADLLLEVKRLYSANLSLYGCLATVASMSRQDPYFTAPQAGGTKALAKGLQALEKARRGYPDQVIHGCYFRYADDLLFGTSIGDGWLVDDTGRMTAVGPERAEQYAGQHSSVLGMPGLQGMLRKFAWSDFEP